MRIHYEHDGKAFRLEVINPNDNYPMFQVHCNDDAFYTGSRVFKTVEEVSAQIDFILSKADMWAVIAA